MFLLFTIVFFAQGNNKIELKNKDIYFYRELRGSGFKQDIFTIVSTNTQKNCKLYEEISKDWFVDKEELGKYPKFIFSSNIDIELPSTLSSSHKFTIEFQSNLNFTFPIHMRYNDCLLGSEYKKIFLKAPIIDCGGQRFELNSEIEARMPVGKLEDTNLVLSVTFVVVVFSVFLIIKNL